MMTAQPQTSKSTLQSNTVVLAAVAILIVTTLGLRLWGLSFGLPFGYHMEEPIYSEAAWDLACNRNLNSPLFQLHTYSLAAGIFAMKTVTLPDVCSTSENHTAPEVLSLARWISTLYGTATIGMVFVLGRLLFNDMTGLLGAAFMAFNFLHVRESHHGTPDATATFIITCTIVVFTLLAQRKTLRWYLLAGLFIALSVSARPTAVLLALPLLYAHLQAKEAFRPFSIRGLLRALLLSRELWLLAVTAAVSYLLMNPQSFVNTLDWLRYWRNFAALGSQGGFGLLRVDELPASVFYLRALAWGAGLPLTLMMGAGLLWAFWKHQHGDFLLVLFIIPYYLLASFAQIYFSRYAIPMMPMLSLLAARLIWDVLGTRRAGVPATVVVGALLLILPAQSIIQYSNLQQTEDTRTESLRWMEENIPPDAKIAAEWHASIPHEFSNVTFVGFYGLSDADAHYQDYVDQGYEYLIVTSFVSDAVMRNPELQANKEQVYEDVRANTTLVHEFLNTTHEPPPPYYIDQVLGPITDLSLYDRPGPNIWIYRIP